MQTDKVTDVIGDSVRVTAQSTGLQIQSVDWSIVGSNGPTTVIASQVLYPRSGFDNKALFPSTVTSPTLSFAWNQQGGDYTIQADVHFFQGGDQVLSIKAHLMTPSGDLILAGIPATPSITGSGSGAVMMDGDINGKPGIVYNATVDPATMPGIVANYGVIQTMNPFRVQYVTTDLLGRNATYAAGVSKATGTPSLPRPLVDDGLGTFYGTSPNQEGGIQTVYGGGGLPPALRLGDSPSLPLNDSMWATSYVFSVTLKDTLMFQPSGGIWVPLGSFTWTVSMTADASSADPSGWSFKYNPTQTTAYAASTDYPKWSDSITYLRETYGEFVWIPNGYQ